MKTRKQKYYYSIFYLIPVLLIQLDSLLYHISALSSTFLVQKDQESLTKNKYISKRNFFVWLIVGLIINYVCVYSAFYIDIDSGINIGRFILLPHYSMLIPLGVSIFWCNKYLIIKKSSKQFKNTIIFLLPTVVNVTVYSFIKPCYLGDKINYINNTWCAIVLAAFFEEIFYRWFIYNLLKGIISVKKSQIITAIIFVSSHFNLLNMIIFNFNISVVYNILMVFLLGIVTCRLYDHTNSIITPILYHAINNGVLYYLISMVIV